MHVTALGDVQHLVIPEDGHTRFVANDGRAIMNPRNVLKDVDHAVSVGVTPGRSVLWFSHFVAPYGRFRAGRVPTIRRTGRHRGVFLAAEDQYLRAGRRPPEYLRSYLGIAKFHKSCVLS